MKDEKHIVYVQCTVHHNSDNFNNSVIISMNKCIVLGLHEYVSGTFVSLFSMINSSEHRI